MRLVDEAGGAWAQDGAHVDPVTALPGYTRVDAAIEGAIKEANKAGLRFAVMAVNVDGFRLVNDSLGYACGDALLREAGRRLSERLPAGSTVCRIGADEFIVIVAEPADSDGGLRVNDFARPIADAARTWLRQPLELDGHELCTTASVGYAVFPDDLATVGDLRRGADMALYHAKQLGRDNCKRFDTAMADATADRLEILARLRVALAENHLSLAWQPQFDQKRKLRGFEVLLRWHDTKLGFVSPARFVPVAEESGLIVPMGQWVLHEAARQMRAWRDEGLVVDRVAVNVSAVQFAQDDFVDSVRQTLDQTGCQSEWLELELTESLLFDRHVGIESATTKLSALRDMGLTTALDDFGTGYSCLAYLHKLPLDTLKIDRSFVAEISDRSHTEADDRTAVVRSITCLAKSLRLKLVAEGVESELQYRFLRSLGCDKFQGYLFAKPLTVIDAQRLITSPPSLLKAEPVSNAGACVPPPPVMKAG